MTTHQYTRRNSPFSPFSEKFDAEILLSPYRGEEEEIGDFPGVLKKTPPQPPATPPAPRIWLHLDAVWRELDRQYLAHHWQCTTCKTAGAGRGDRCDTGQRLHHRLAQAVRSA